MDSLESEPKRPLSQGSSRFRESVHLIPTPGVDRKRPKRYEPVILKVWIVGSIGLLMIAMAVGLEVAIHFSSKDNGFSVPQQNVLTFVSSQFLTSFIPTLFVAPLAFLWAVTDWMVRWYQPYVTLSRGDAPAGESLLLDYIALNKIATVLFSFKHRHWLVHFSALTVLATYLLQPLAGSIFQIRMLPQTQDGTVTSVSAIGLSPDFANLNAFSAAAGFAEAAVFNSLPDPPFIEGGWTAAEFEFPKNPMLNGSMTANTTGIQTNVNCSSPAILKLNTPSSTDYTIAATSSQGCSINVTFNPSSSDQQYGVVNIPNCGSVTNVTFQPVLFWYFHINGGSLPEARGVFCQPSIKPFDIIASADLNNGNMTNVTIIDNYPVPNNVTGAPLSGQAFNGVIFENSSDPFVAARATATKSAVPGAIFRFASQLPGGPQSTFDQPNGFLSITTRVYTQHLAVAAKSTYFIPANQQISAKMTSLAPRLWVEPLSGHALAIILLLIGVVGIVLHFVHRRARRDLWLTAPPGSIAAIVSLTSRSGFGELLLPYDDDETMKRKLIGLKFRLDRRTGAIVADEEDHIDLRTESEDAMMSLLGQRHNRTSTAPHGYPDLPFEPFGVAHDA